MNAGMSWLCRKVHGIRCCTSISKHWPQSSPTTLWLPLLQSSAKFLTMQQDILHALEIHRDTVLTLVGGSVRSTFSSSSDWHFLRSIRQQCLADEVYIQGFIL